MIDENNHLRCDNCKKKLGEELTGRVAIVCPRCKRFNTFDTDKLPKVYSSHKVLGLTRLNEVGTI